eukprot:scaffold23617_cov90-Isochrysis_galbana.AAC.2
MIPFVGAVEGLSVALSEAAAGVADFKKALHTSGGATTAEPQRPPWGGQGEKTINCCPNLPVFCLYSPSAASASGANVRPSRSVTRTITVAPAVARGGSALPLPSDCRPSPPAEYPPPPAVINPVPTAVDSAAPAVNSAPPA